MTKYEQYVEDIIEKRIIHCQKTRQAIIRHKRDLNNVEKEDFPYYFDAEEADKTIAFVEQLEMYEGTGQDKKLILEGFQAFIVASIFGWKRKDTHTRRYKKAFLFLARGNGKSPLMAALALISLIKDAGGQIYSIATTHSQASIVFKWCSNFVQRNKKLSEIITVFNAALEYKKNGSVLKPLSKSFKSFDGFNPSLIIADEVSAMVDDSLISVMETALHKRLDSLLLMITTANFISVKSPGYLEYDYSTKVLNGTIKDDRYFSIIYELDKGDNWKDDRNLIKSNPASFVMLDELKHAQIEAQNAPTKENAFRTKNLNEWLIGSNNEWLSDEKWKSSITNYEKYKEYLTEDKLIHYPSCIGSDLSDRHDLSVYTIAFYIKELDKIYLKHKVYIPQNTLGKKDLNDNKLFSNWVRDGLVILCEGDSQDRKMIGQDIVEDIKKYKPKTFGYDPYMSNEVVEVVENEIDTVAISQKMEILSEPTKDFEELILQSKIIDDNPIMRWCMNNARLYESNKRVKIQKISKDSSQRIDLVISALMAVFKLREYVKLDTNRPPVRDYKKLSQMLYG